jgi:tRNA(adenine34) deaminase
MRVALEEAQKAYLADEIPVGAIVVKNGEIIGRGSNKRLLMSMPFAHAEMSALAEAGEALKSWRFDGCALYVTLEPCLMCAGAIVETRVSKVVYGATDPRSGAAGSLYDVLNDARLPRRVFVVKGLLASACSAPLKKFFLARREREARDD